MRKSNSLIWTRLRPEGDDWIVDCRIDWRKYTQQVMLDNIHDLGVLKPVR